MATYYVGSGGNNGNDGLSWANRKLTLNGVEDIPVASGDVVYVAPGVYREVLTVDVSGASAITYIGDVTGEHTDGIGGIVRVTGSDNDTTAARANCITATSKNYRTFRGFTFNIASGNQITMQTSCSNWIIEDCVFADAPVSTGLLDISGTGTANTIRRCIFVPSANGGGIYFAHSSTVSDTGHLVENCLFLSQGSNNGTIRIERIGGITIKNCTFFAQFTAIRVATALAGGQTITCNNNILVNAFTGFQATTTGEITENYNTLFGCSTARTNTATGANSVAYPALFAWPILLDGLRMPWNPFTPSDLSLARRIAGTAMASEELFGIVRPSTDSKKSWGAVQYADVSRGTATVRTGTASLYMADAGAYQMFVPTSGAATVFQAYVYRGTAYAGTLPQLAIIQPGASGTVWTDTGGSAGWNLVGGTLTPAGTPLYVVAEFRSNNSGTAGDYTVWWDDFTVT